VIDVGVFLLILKCFNNSTFFNVVCISWILKCRLFYLYRLETLHDYTSVQCTEVGNDRLIFWPTAYPLLTVS